MHTSLAWKTTIENDSVNNEVALHFVRPFVRSRISMIEYIEDNEGIVDEF